MLHQLMSVSTDYTNENPGSATELSERIGTDLIRFFKVCVRRAVCSVSVDGKFSEFARSATQPTLRLNVKLYIILRLN